MDNAVLEYDDDFREHGRCYCGQQIPNKVHHIMGRLRGNPRGQVNLERSKGPVVRQIKVLEHGRATFYGLRAKRYGLVRQRSEDWDHREDRLPVQRVW